MSFTGLMGFRELGNPMRSQVILIMFGGFLFPGIRRGQHIHKMGISQWTGIMGLIGFKGLKISS
jgi:hypothetical protein